MKEKKLNSIQERAAQSIERPVCILAGAGCGKTTVLVEHYLQLLSRKKLRPFQIVVTTFSEKSAADIKKHLLEALREKDPQSLEEFSQAPISTIHGLAGRILREASLLVGLDPHFRILDDNDAAFLKKQTLHENMRSLLGSSSPALKLLVGAYGWQALERLFSFMLKDWPRWKELCHLASILESNFEKGIQEALSQIFLKILGDYEAKKRLEGVLDFNDLEEKALLLLEQYPHVLRHYQNLWKAFLVDEFQDTSSTQDKLLSFLLGLRPEEKLSSKSHLAIVGDPKQSIYAFRGAKPHIFENYRKMIEASGGITFHLNQNYRSPQAILDFVNELFLPIFPDYKNLEAAASSPQVIEAIRSDEKIEGLKVDEKRKLEAKILAKRAHELLQEGASAHQIFLLFRSSGSLPIYLKAFRQEGLPVFVKSGGSLLDRQEVLDLLHAMRVVLNPFNTLSWVGLLRSPACGLSDEILLEQSLQNDFKPAWPNLHPLGEKLLSQNKAQGPRRFLEWFLDETQLISLYSAEESLALKAQNILQFLHWSSEWENSHSGGLSEFLQEIDALCEEGIEVNALSDQLGLGEAITFMTIHQSKGLNLPIVILPDLQTHPNHSNAKSLVCAFQNSWGIKTPDPKPGLKKSLKASELFKENLNQLRLQEEEEENRIFYVATTRSMEKLILGFLPEAKENSLPLKAKERLREVLQRNPKLRWIETLEKEEALKALPPLLLDRKAVIEAPLEIFHSRNLVTQFAVTQLECYLRSKEEYFERYICQIPAENTGGQRISKSVLSPLEKGKLLHEALYLMTQSTSPLSLSEVMEFLSAKHHLSSPAKKDLKNLEKSLQDTLQHPHFQNISKAPESYSEIPFRLSLEPYVIHGAMDRFIRQGNGWEIIDYKTHQFSNSQKPPDKNEFEFQLKTYCLAASRMLASPVQKALIYFTSHNIRQEHFFSEIELDQHEQSLRNLMQEINKVMYNAKDGLAN